MAEVFGKDKSIRDVYGYPSIFTDTFFYHMKKHIFVCLILACSVVSKVNAQNAEIRIKEQFNAYSKFVADKNFEKAIEYTNPGLFKIISKEQLIMILKRTFNSPDFEFKIGLPTLTDFHPVKTIHDSSYVKFASESILQMKFKEDTGKVAPKPEDQKQKNALRKSALANGFGAGNVNFDETTGFFVINSKKVVIAASNKAQMDWKFAIIDNERVKKVLKTFIPSEIIEE
jgi:hypothetical protein